MRNATFKTLLCALLLAPVAQAAELQSDWIKPEAGQSEKTLGATVKAVETGDNGEGTRVTVAIPKASLGEEQDIEEVVVVGRKPDKSEERLEIRHEWVADYDNDNYGLILYMGKNGDIPLRLYLKAE